MEPPDERPTEAPLYSGSFTSGPGFPQQMARAFFRFSMTRRRTILVYVLLVVVIAALGYTTNARTPVVIPILVIVVLAFALGFSYRSLVTRFRRTSPAGSSYSLQLGETTLVSTNPLARSEVKYAAFSELHIVNGLVLLKSSTSRLYSIFPAQLFTPESLAYLRSRIPGKPA